MKIKKITQQFPNVLTTSRGVIGLILPFLFFGIGNLNLTLGLIVAGAFSDLIDGPLARILNAQSRYGEVADQVSDKIFGFSSLLITATLNPIMGIPLFFESLIGGVNSINYWKNKKKNIAPAPTSGIGKVKTAVLFPTIFVSLFLNFNPVIMFPLVLVTSTLQGITLAGYTKKLFENNVKKEDAVEIENTELDEEKKSEETLEKSKQLQKKMFKNKFIKLRKEVEDLIDLKENWERNLGEKIDKDSIERKFKK